jgi:DNA-binding transcriptional ArsR family regulator
MRQGLDIARVAAVLGDPARANMAVALMGGAALTAGELAAEAGVTPQTASSHLARLADGGLVTARRQGRHAYFTLSGPEVAELLESLMGLGARGAEPKTRPGPREPALRKARVCYDHLAGELGVGLLDSLVGRGLILDHDGALELTGEGAVAMRAFGVDPARRGRRPLCRACLDWSERRSHLAGSLGAAILERIYERGWARRMEGSRVVAFSAPGLAAFQSAFPAP